MSAIEIKEVQNVTYEVDGKIYRDYDEAVAAKAKLRHLETGLEFAAAQYPDIAERAKRGKANTIAEFLAWEEQGRPVKESEAVAEDSEAA